MPTVSAFHRPSPSPPQLPLLASFLSRVDAPCPRPEQALQPKAGCPLQAGLRAHLHLEAGVPGYLTSAWPAPHLNVGQIIRGASKLLILNWGN